MIVDGRDGSSVMLTNDCWVRRMPLRWCWPTLVNVELINFKIKVSFFISDDKTLDLALLSLHFGAALVKKTARYH